MYPRLNVVHIFYVSLFIILLREIFGNRREQDLRKQYYEFTDTFKKGI